MEYYPDRVCRCGCGGRIKVRSHHSYYGIPEYINGHARRGKHHTEEAKEKLSKLQLGTKNSMYGKKQSKEIIRKRIETRRNNGKPWHSEEARKKYSATKIGEKNPMFGLRPEDYPGWRGGISKLPYSFKFDIKLKEFIRERDNRICQLCEKTEEENGRRLTVHHIDYNKEHCDPENLISLCIGCNSKVNSNREFWTQYFRVKLESR